MSTSHCTCHVGPRGRTAIVNENGRAFDTFWGLDGRSDNYYLSDDELAGAVLLFNLSEYRALGAHYERRHEEWLKYAPADRQRIGSQHQYQSTYFVRAGATPDLETQIANARAALGEAESAVLSARQTVEWRKEDLAKLEAARV